MALMIILTKDWHHINTLRRMAEPSRVQGITKIEGMSRLIRETTEPILAVIDLPMNDHSREVVLNELSALNKPMSIIITEIPADVIERHYDGLDITFIPWKKLITPETSTCLVRFLNQTPTNHRWELIGSSPVMDKVRQELEIAAISGLPIHITGETGTGKEIAAHMIHETLHPNGPDIIIANCSCFSDTLAPCKLFGTRRGAYTDAKEDSPGLVELANGSSLFLDELEDLSEQVQPLLLRLLENGTYQRVGDAATRHTHFHMISASNIPLATLRSLGRLRNDLFYRLNGYTIKMPPLRAHKEDIPLLVDHYLRRTSERRPVEPSGMTLLETSYWRGNVRELFSILRLSIAKSHGRDAIHIDEQALMDDDQPFLPFAG